MPTNNMYVFLRLDRITGNVVILEWKTAWKTSIEETLREFVK